jgi:hypothetical protein
MALPFARQIVSHRKSGSAEEAEIMAQHMAENVPPAVLRVIALQGSKLYATEGSPFEGTIMDKTPAWLPITGTDEVQVDEDSGQMQPLGPLNPTVGGAYDARTNEGNVVFRSYDLGKPQMLSDGSNGEDAAIKECLNAYNDAVNASSDPEFLKARVADLGALPDNESRATDIAAEEFSSYATAYLTGDHSLRSDHPNIWRFMLQTFGPR